MTTYQRGETLRITATITDSDGAAADPSTTTISIEKTDGTLAVDESAMTQSVSGSYYYDYDIPSDGGIGSWEYNVIATGSGGRKTIVRSWFNVEVAI